MVSLLEQMYPNIKYPSKSLSFCIDECAQVPTNHCDQQVTETFNCSTSGVQICSSHTKGKGSHSFDTHR